MRGLWGDWWHPAAPEHRVQPGLVDCVEGEIDVGLGKVPGKKGGGEKKEKEKENIQALINLCAEAADW